MGDSKLIIWVLISHWKAVAGWWINRVKESVIPGRQIFKCRESLREYVFLFSNFVFVLVYWLFDDSLRDFPPIYQIFFCFWFVVHMPTISLYFCYYFSMFLRLITFWINFQHKSRWDRRCLIIPTILSKKIQKPSQPQFLLNLKLLIQPNGQFILLFSLCFYIHLLPDLIRHSFNGQQTYMILIGEYSINLRDSD